MIEKINYVFSKTEKIKFVGILFLMIIGSLLELLGVSVFLPFIEGLVAPNEMQQRDHLKSLYNMFHFNSTEEFLLAFGIAICVVYIGKNLYLIFMHNTMLNFSYKTRMKLATRLLTTYMLEPYSFHLNRNIAVLQRTLQIDTTQFMQLINGVLQVLAELAVVVCLGLYLFITSPTISIVMMGMVGVCILFFSLVSKKVAKRIGRQNEEYNAQLFQWVNQSLGGIKDVKVLNRENYFIDSYRGVYKKLIKGAKNCEMLALIPRYTVETMCIVGMIIAVIGKIFFGVRDLNAFVVQMSAFAVASFRLMPSVGKINAFINNIMYNLPSFELIYQDLKDIEDMEDAEKLRNSDNYRISDKDKAPKWNLESKIELKNIVYSYNEDSGKVLDMVDMDIHKGETVALIGSSGAGKTTMADVLLGLLIPQNGSILVDGKNIYENMDSWHTMLGYIPQSIYLSDDTIRNNIAFGIREDDIDDKAIEEALKQAQLYDFVMSLEDGVNTFVGDRGVRLSGGQRQRIGIARALYYDPEILVLDEATSALDNETETAVMEAIDGLRGVKTMVIIAHRLTTIRNADTIYEIADGKAIKRSKEDVFSEN